MEECQHPSKLGIQSRQGDQHSLDASGSIGAFRFLHSKVVLVPRGLSPFYTLSVDVVYIVEGT